MENLPLKPTHNIPHPTRAVRGLKKGIGSHHVPFMFEVVYKSGKKAEGDMKHILKK